MASFQYLAREMARAFETIKRFHGLEIIVAFKKGSPQWMHDIVKYAYKGEDIPDEKTHEVAWEAVAWFADAGDEGDAMDRFTGGMGIEKAYKPLMNWAERRPYSLKYIEYAIRYLNPETLIEAVRLAMIEWQTDVGESVLQSLINLSEESES